MKITKIKQHWLDWGQYETCEKFINYYHAEQKRSIRNFMIDSLNMQTNQEWLNVRKGRYTASNANKLFWSKEMTQTSKDLVCQVISDRKSNCFEDTENRQETIYMKQGLIFEARALELLSKELKTEIKTDIGFISNEYNGLFVGVSPDAYIGDSESPEIIIENKARLGGNYLSEVMKFGKKETLEQIQFGLNLCAKSARKAIVLFYDIENDRIQYCTYTRGLSYISKWNEQIPEILKYEQEVLETMKYTDLTQKIMEG